jgi:small-conductance mechanosensitive channel
MALSLTAIAVALVIATKEMILCVMGSLLRASARAFTIGDRIEIEGVHGDVIDHGLFATTILEVGPGHLWTGRALTVPNSMFLSSPITNESFATRYVLHIIRVPISRQEIEGASDVLKAIGEEVCAPFLPEARDHLEAEAARHGLERPLVNPRVTIALVDPANVDLLLRIPTPVRDRGDIEQEVLRRWFATMF